MTTAVVVATVVEANMSEAAVRQAVLDQLREHDRNLQASLAASLAHRDGGAQVVTAILNVDDFMQYMLQRFPRPADAAPADPAAQTTAAVAAPPAVTPDQTVMGEIEFMNYLLDQTQAGLREAPVYFDDDELAALDDENPGEEFARSPFYY